MPESTWEWVNRLSVEQGKCLIWQACLSNHGTVPMVYRPGSKKQTMTTRRRIALECGIKLDELPGYWAVATCGNQLCVRPQHIKLVPRGERIVLIKRRVTAEVLQATAKAGKKRRKWTDEQVMLALKMRDEGATYTEITQAIGCPYSTVPQLLERARKQANPPAASVFNPALVLAASREGTLMQHQP